MRHLSAFGFPRCGVVFYRRKTTAEAASVLSFASNLKMARPAAKTLCRQVFTFSLL